MGIGVGMIGRRPRPHTVRMPTNQWARCMDRETARKPPFEGLFLVLNFVGGKDDSEFPKIQPTQPSLSPSFSPSSAEGLQEEDKEGSRSLVFCPRLRFRPHRLCVLPHFFGTVFSSCPMLSGCSPGQKATNCFLLFFCYCYIFFSIHQKQKKKKLSIKKQKTKKQKNKKQKKTCKSDWLNKLEHYYIIHLAVGLFSFTLSKAQSMVGFPTLFLLHVCKQDIRTRNQPTNHATNNPRNHSMGRGRKE